VSVRQQVRRIGVRHALRETCRCQSQPESCRACQSSRQGDDWHSWRLDRELEGILDIHSPWWRANYPPSSPKAVWCASRSVKSCVVCQLSSHKAVWCASRSVKSCVVCQSSSHKAVWCASRLVLKLCGVPVVQ